MTTLRLVLPQWQGGMNPNYVLGSELLAHIAPPSQTDETITIDVSKNFDGSLATENGIDRYEELSKQTLATLSVLADKNPDKVITFGGDCSISQSPFAYLSEKYGNSFGVLWLDAHPDVATIDYSTHLHEMVLGNLIGKGAPKFAEIVKKPVLPSHVMCAGLIKEELREGLDNGIRENQIRYATPADLVENSQPILDWLTENEIATLAVHFDLDVLSPNDFRSIYPAKPGTQIKDFPAAIGELNLTQVMRILNDVSNQVSLVGLSIAEHLPWDAINLRNALSQIDIFHS